MVHVQKVMSSCRTPMRETIFCIMITTGNVSRQSSVSQREPSSPLPLSVFLSLKLYNTQICRISDSNSKSIWNLSLSIPFVCFRPVRLNQGWRGENEILERTKERRWERVREDRGLQTWKEAIGLNVCPIPDVIDLVKVGSTPAAVGRHVQYKYDDRQCYMHNMDSLLVSNHSASPSVLAISWTNQIPHA